ncbi:MAG: DnaJ domain-containing protein [Myxococcota bacterium]
MSDLDAIDYYALLGIPDEAPIPAIKRAFRKFARKYHPDRFAGAPADKVARAEAIYRRGSEAFQVLTDPRTRQAYDLALRQGKLRLTGEEQAKAAAPEVETPKKKASPIKSPQALTYFKKGIAAAHQGDWKASWRFLKMAMDAEPNNDFIEQRFYQVDRRLRGG